MKNEKNTKITALIRTDDHSENKRIEKLRLILPTNSVKLAPPDTALGEI